MTISSSAAGREALPLPAKPRLTGKASAAWIMRPMCHGPGVQVVALVPAAGPVPPPSMVVTPRHQRFVDLLRADEMDVAVEAAGGEDFSFAGDDLGAGADDDGDAGLDVGIAGLADGGDAAVLQADIGLDDAPVVEDQRVGDDGVDGALPVGDLRLAHAVADHLAAAELHLLAVDGEILLDLDDEIGVGEPHAVAGGGAEHVGIGRAFRSVTDMISSSRVHQSQTLSPLLPARAHGG